MISLHDSKEHHRKQELGVHDPVCAEPFLVPVYVTIYTVTILQWRVREDIRRLMPPLPRILAGPSVASPPLFYA